MEISILYNITVHLYIVSDLSPFTFLQLIELSLTSPMSSKRSVTSESTSQSSPSSQKRWSLSLHHRRSLTTPSHEAPPTSTLLPRVESQPLFLIAPGLDRCHLKMSMTKIISLPTFPLCLLRPKIRKVINTFTYKYIILQRVFLLCFVLSARGNSKIAIIKVTKESHFFLCSLCTCIMLLPYPLSTPSLPTLHPHSTPYTLSTPPYLLSYNYWDSVCISLWQSWTSTCKPRRGEGWVNLCYFRHSHTYCTFRKKVFSGNFLLYFALHVKQLSVVVLYMYLVHMYNIHNVCKSVGVRLHRCASSFTCTLCIHVLRTTSQCVSYVQLLTFLLCFSF